LFGSGGKEIFRAPDDRAEGADLSVYAFLLSKLQTTGLMHYVKKPELILFPELDE
jgi:hypothetical protein